jgi:hypothetical protein
VGGIMTKVQKVFAAALFAVPMVSQAGTFDLNFSGTSEFCAAPIQRRW